GRVAFDEMHLAAGCAHIQPRPAEGKVGPIGAGRKAQLSDVEVEGGVDIVDVDRYVVYTGGPHQPRAYAKAAATCGARSAATLSARRSGRGGELVRPSGQLAENWQLLEVGVKDGVVPGCAEGHVHSLGARVDVALDLLAGRIGRAGDRPVAHHGRHRPPA